MSQPIQKTTQPIPITMMTGCMTSSCHHQRFVSALVIRVAYGPGFAADPVDDATYTSELARMSSSYLLSESQRAGR
jgi:hypothetical protein